MASSRFSVLSSVVVTGVVAAALSGCGPARNSDSSYPTSPAQSKYQASSSGTTYGSGSGSGAGSGSGSGSGSMSSGSGAQSMTVTPPPSPVDDGKHVPRGARMVSSGAFPPPSFEVSEGGMLYVFDEDTNSVALTTSVGSSQINRNINLNDFPNVSNSLNNKHRFRVYFVPNSASTTLPAPLGQ